MFIRGRDGRERGIPGGHDLRGEEGREGGGGGWLERRGGLCGVG